MTTFTPKELKPTIFECDKCGALILIEDEAIEKHIAWHERNDLEVYDTASAESVRYYIAFHRSQQQKKEKAKPKS